MPPKITFFSDTCPKSCGRWARLGRVKLSLGFRKPKKRKGSALGGRHPRKPRFARAPHPPSERDEGLRGRAEAAIAEARKSHERLRQAIEILPQGIVFLDAEGRYVLWNKQYAEIYSKTADLFEEGARLEDTLRIGVARGDYPEAAGHEEEWIAERLQKLYQPGSRHEQKLADGRVILIDERLTEDGGVVGLRVDITELKQREASFRLLFDGNPVPMIVCALDGEPGRLSLQALAADDRLLQRLSRAKPRRLGARCVDLVLAFGRVGQNQHPVACHLQEPAPNRHRLLGCATLHAHHPRQQRGQQRRVARQNTHDAIGARRHDHVHTFFGEDLAFRGHDLHS